MPDEKPHIDAVSGQAAWLLAQILAMELVKAGVISKQLLREDIDRYVQTAKRDPNMNPAQRGAAHLLKDLHTLLQTADKRDSN